MKEESSTTTLKENGFDNPYQYTRAIRFKVKPQSQSQCFQKKLQWDKSQVDIPELSNLLLKVYTGLGKLLFFSHKTDDDDKEDAKNKEPKFNKKLSVSKNWLKVWHKNIFHASIKNLRNKDGKYKLQELELIHEDESLKKWLENWKEKVDQLKRYSQQLKEFQARHSDIAYLIRWFLNNKRLPYIQAFLNEAHTSESNLDNQIKSLKSDLEQLQKDLKTAEQIYLSSDSSGIEIAKASFNYYTVNKKPKDYYENKLAKLEKRRYEECCSKIENKNGYIWHTLNKNGQKDQKILTFKSDLEKKWLERYIDKYNKDESNEYKIKGDLQNRVELSLDQTYHAMKAFKAEQKSIFYEVMKHIASDKKSGSSYEVKKNHLLKEYKLGYEQFDLEGINQTFSLFQFDNKHKNKYYTGKAEEKYNEFIELTRNIEQEQDSQKKRDTAKKRGRDFLFGKNCYFAEYGNFCEGYKKVAQELGKLIAQIKGIEKEKEEAKQTSYWSLIYVENDHKKLWLIPKDKMQDAKKDINELAEQNNSLGCPYLCCFESLTMRALHKLCFAEQSTFVEAMPDYLKDLRTKTKAINKKESNNQAFSQSSEQKRERKKEEELKFFKKVLEWQQGLPESDEKKTLQLKHFSNLQEVHQTEEFNEFEKALERACYHVKEIPLNEEEKQNFIKNHDVTVLNMTSYDLEGRNKNTHQTPASKNKYHTDLWKVFWENIDKPDKTATVKNFPVGEVRLNPEVKIRYRRADDALEKYLNNKDFPTKFKHRKKQEQLTIGLTLALNAGNKYEDLAFAKPEDLCEKINGFNAKFNSEKDFKTAWKYGIDRGQTELATLCLAQFNLDQDIYEANDKKVVKSKLASIECYTLKDYNYQILFDDGKQREKTHQRAIDNLSYFIDDKYKSLFDIKPTSCLDLTTAKVIKGKIVINGDVRTYLKLKKVSAKRKLYELYGKGQVDSTAKLEWSKYKFEYKNGKESKQHHPEGVLNINIGANREDPETAIYHYCNKYKDIISEKCIEKDLNRYLDELKSQDERHTPSILQINHLRNALTANIVGVISYLYKTYPGFILLEDLEKGKTKENDNIYNRLEVALYNKFQSLSLVPPHVKDIIQLREDVRKQQKDNKESIRSSQIGAIVFVDEFNTSKNCPYCEEKQTHKEKNDEKFKQKRFRCQSCGFDTYAFKTEEEREKDYTPEVKPSFYNEKFEFLKDINDPDKVAAYNIAKKIKDSSEIGKWKFLPSETREQIHNSKSFYGQEQGQNKNNQRVAKHKNPQSKHNQYKIKKQWHKTKDQKNGSSRNHHKIASKNPYSKNLTNQPFAVLKTMQIKTNVNHKESKESKSDEN